MGEEHKRFTISVDPALEKELNIVKQKNYDNVTENAMICDLITRGIQAADKEYPNKA